MEYYATDQKTINFIEKASLTNLSNWIFKNPTLLYRYHDTICEKLNKTIIWVTNRYEKPEYCTMKEVQSFISRIMSRTFFTEKEFELLKIVSNRVLVLNSDAGSYPDMSIRNKMIVTLLTDIDKMKDYYIGLWGETKDDVIHCVFRSIIDTYITTDHPEEIIKELMSYDFTEMIRHCGETDWIMTLYDRHMPNLEVELKEIILVDSLKFNSHYTLYQVPCSFHRRYRHSFTW